MHEINPVSCLLFLHSEMSQGSPGTCDIFLGFILSANYPGKSYTVG